MEDEYTLRELTSREMFCGIGTCPAIYELKRKTPESMLCWPAPGCPEIYEGGEGTSQEGKYILIGKLVDPSEFGLEGRVGDGEVLVSVPKKLIDDKRE